MGPWLVTRDEIEDPHDLDVRLRIGGAVLQSGSTRDLIFSIRDIIAHLSMAMTLEPGDIIATGTPSGIGATRTPPRFLQAGDVVEVEIEGVGTLANPVAREAG